MIPKHQTYLLKQICEKHPDGDGYECGRCDLRKRIKNEFSKLNFIPSSWKNEINQNNNNIKDDVKIDESNCCICPSWTGGNCGGVGSDCYSRRKY